MPSCPGSYGSSTWPDCFGTEIYKDRVHKACEYTGEFEEGRYCGVGIFNDFYEKVIREATLDDGEFKLEHKVSFNGTGQIYTSTSDTQQELEKLRKQIARFKNLQKKKPDPKPTPKTATSSS